MLLLHVIDSCLLLLHDFWQLQFVLKLVAHVSLWRLFARILQVHHFVLTWSLIHVKWGSCLVMNRLAVDMVVLGSSHISLTNLVSDPKVGRLCCRLTLVHLNWWGSWTLGLVRDLDLTSPDLNCRCVLLSLSIGGRLRFLVCWDLWEPFSRAIRLHLTLSDAHAVIWWEYRLMTSCTRIVYTILVGDCHLWVIAHLSLSYHLRDLRRRCSCQVNLVCHIAV